MEPGQQTAPGGTPRRYQGFWSFFISSKDCQSGADSQYSLPGPGWHCEDTFLFQSLNCVLQYYVGQATQALCIIFVTSVSFPKVSMCVCDLCLLFVKHILQISLLKGRSDFLKETCFVP